MGKIIDDLTQEIKRSPVQSEILGRAGSKLGLSDYKIRQLLEKGAKRELWFVIQEYDRGPKLYRREGCEVPQLRLSSVATPNPHESTAPEGA